MVRLFTPKQEVRNSRDKPLFLNEEASKAIKNKNRSWKRFLQRQTIDRYQQYTKERDKSNKILRSIKCHHEKHLVNDIKKNGRPFFFKYAARKNEVKGHVCNILKSDRTIDLADEC